MVPCWPIPLQVLGLAKVPGRLWRCRDSLRGLGQYEISQPMVGSLVAEIRPFSGQDSPAPILLVSELVGRRSSSGVAVESLDVSSMCNWS